MELALTPSQSNALFGGENVISVMDEVQSEQRLEMETAKAIFIFKAKLKFRLSRIGFHTC